MASYALLLASTVTASAAAQPQPAFRLVPTTLPLPTPTDAQLKYQGSMNALIHFGMATFFHDGDPGCDAGNWNGCDPNGGCNSSDPASFNPTLLSVDNWLESFRAIPGLNSAVLTAKHGCGFLSWKTNVTLPDGSPYTYHVLPQFPVLELFVAAMRGAGMGYGFYYSLTNNEYLNVRGHSVQPPSTLLPGQVQVTQAQFEAIALGQVQELWTQFGNLTEVWLDGGCGAMCNSVGKLVRSTNAAGAVVFNGGGVSDHPVRWCGTEGGQPDGWPTIWSTVVCPDTWCGPGSGGGDPPNASSAVWMPSGVDVTLQAGDRWFYMPGAPLTPLSTLASYYHRSVGANAHLELDFAIDRTGRVAPAHAAAYAAFGAWIAGCYGSPLASATMPTGATSVTLSLGAAPQAVDRVMMQENQTLGQAIVTYTVEALDGSSGQWRPFTSGTTVGAKRIDIAAGGPVSTTSIRFSVTSAFAVPTAGFHFSAFAPAPCATSLYE